MALNFLNNGYFAGKVGIGETNPATALQVDSISAFPTLTLARSTTHSGISFTAGISNFTGAGADLLFDGVGNSTGFGFRTKNSSGTQINALVIAPSGNVGITETNPLHKLSIKSTDNTRGILINNTSTGSYAELHLKANREYRIGTGGSATAADAKDNFYIYDATAATHRITLTSAGDFGIGTFAPVLKLDVEGTASTPTPFGSAALNGVVRIASGSSNPILDIGSNSAAPYEMWLQAHVPANTYGTPLSLQPLGGNVGIGITSPADKLDLFDVNDNVGMYFHTTTSGTGSGQGLRVGQNNSNAFVWNYENTPLSLATNGSAKLTVNGNGTIRFNAYNLTNNTGTPTYVLGTDCLLYTSPSPRDRTRSRMPSSA